MLAVANTSTTTGLGRTLAAIEALAARRGLVSARTATLDVAVLAARLLQQPRTLFVVEDVLGDVDAMFSMLRCWGEGAGAALIAPAGQPASCTAAAFLIIMRAETLLAWDSVAAVCSTRDAARCSKATREAAVGRPGARSGPFATALHRHRAGVEDDVAAVLRRVRYFLPLPE